VVAKRKQRRPTVEAQCSLTSHTDIVEAALAKALAFQYTIIDYNSLVVETSSPSI
jgi:hypothetical protein